MNQTVDVPGPEDLYALLMQERPKLHGFREGAIFQPAVFDWGLHPAVLRWLLARVRPGLRTLETGCGYSTIVFALGGCRHDAISPFPEEHRSINEWCQAHGGSVDTITYWVGSSQRLLPAMNPTPLDLVLIDGSHSVPVPLIDFFYTADRLVEGGLLVVDDLQLRSVQQLCDFLDTEAPRWAFVEQIDRTRMYRKCVEGTVIEGIHWMKQPFCTVTPPAPLELSLLARVRRKIRRTLSI